MSYRCEICQQQQRPGRKAEKTVLSIREVKYPACGDNKEGFETVKEVLCCYACFKQHEGPVTISGEPKVVTSPGSYTPPRLFYDEDSDLEPCGRTRSFNRKNPQVLYDRNVPPEQYEREKDVDWVWSPDEDRMVTRKNRSG